MQQSPQKWFNLTKNLTVPLSVITLTRIIHLLIAKIECNLYTQSWNIPFCYSSKLTLLSVSMIASTQLEQKPDGTASNKYSSYK